MADAGGSCLNLGAPMEQQGRGRPCGSKNKATLVAAGASSTASVKWCPGRPVGSRKKPKVPPATLGPSTPPGNASPP
jgi:hypothetical protein